MTDFNSPVKDEQIKDNASLYGQDPLIGEELAGRYLVQELIGTGGWGNVYRAQHQSLGSSVAIKVIHRHLAQDEASLKRLEHEAKALNSLDSPYIVRILDFGMMPAPFIVMEYFDGTPLNTWVKEQGTLSFAQAISLFQQMCEGLEKARELGLVHRDLKPANVMVKITRDQLSSKILDFGIAKIMNDNTEGEKITVTGEVLGSPPYMPPEQWAGRVDHRTDIYSLGCVIYEALSGKQVFNANYGIEYLNLHINQAPMRIPQTEGSKFPEAFERVILKCIQKEPQHRYQTCKEILNDLQAIKSDKRVHIKLVPGKKSWKKEILIGTSAAVVLPSLVYLYFNYGGKALCRFVNDQADKDTKAHKLDDAVFKYKMLVSLASPLPDQLDVKIHSLRTLSKLLIQQHKMAEAGIFQRELYNETGARISRPLQNLIQKIRQLKTPIVDMAAADNLIKQLLAEAEKSGKNSLSYAAALSSACSVYQAEGRYDKALEASLNAAKIAGELSDESSPFVAERLNKLGEAYINVGQGDQAEKVLRRALNLNTKYKQPASCVSNLNNIGLALFRAGKQEEAHKVLQSAFDLSIANSGSNLGPVIDSTVKCYVIEGNYDKAIDFFQEQLAKIKKQGFENTPTAELLWTCLGGIYSDQQKYKQAEDCLDNSIKLCQSCRLGQRRTIAVLSFIVPVKSKLGKESEAAALAKTASQIGRLSTHNNYSGMSSFERYFTAQGPLYQERKFVRAAVDEKEESGISVKPFMGLLQNLDKLAAENKTNELAAELATAYEQLKIPSLSKYKSSLKNDVLGNWVSEFGPVQIWSEGDKLVGRWKQGRGLEGKLSDGTYNPKTRELEIAYWQNWDRERGRVLLHLSSDNYECLGHYTVFNKTAKQGAWTMQRPVYSEAKAKFSS